MNTENQYHDLNGSTIQSGYVICDNTSSSDKFYIDNDGNNTSTVENIGLFTTKNEAEQHIQEQGWEAWAVAMLMD